MRVFVLILLMATSAIAEERREFRLHAAPEIEQSGLLGYLVPRFSLKTGRRVVTGEPADASLVPADPGEAAVMAREDKRFALRLLGDNEAAVRFAEWLASPVGRATLGDFIPETGAPFLPAEDETVATVTRYEGDTAAGARLAASHCGRCHRTAKGTGMTIGSTPSFPALRALADWSDRMGAFYLLNPHPAFLRVEGLSPPFDPARPPPIVPVLLQIEEVEAIQAYVSALAPADLGRQVEAR